MGAATHCESMLQHTIAQFATAMQQICYYESVLDGAARDYAVQEDMWRTQVEAADRVCVDVMLLVIPTHQARNESERRNKELQAQVEKVWSC